MILVRRSVQKGQGSVDNRVIMPFCFIKLHYIIFTVW